MVFLALILCFAGAFFFVGVGFLIWFILRQSKPYTAPETAQNEAKAAESIARNEPTLPTWHAGSLAEMSCRWKGSWGGFTVGHFEGVVGRLNHHDDEIGVLSFHESTKGRRGVLQLQTSDRKMRLDIDADKAQITLDQQPFGAINMADGTLFDETGQAVGSRRRRPGNRMLVGHTPTSSKYNSVELHGRVIAEINDVMTSGVLTLTAKAENRPLFRNLLPDLSIEEENWLLALAAMELHYSIVRKRKTHG